MYKIYFKQAIQMLKQNPFISIISILGTAFAIMMIMAIVVTNEIKTMSASPEINRYRTLYITDQAKRDTVRQSMYSGAVTYDIVSEYLSKLESPEYVCVTNWIDPGNTTLTNREGSNDFISTMVKKTNGSYWKVFSFDFIKGRSYSDEEFESGICNAVLSESTAKRIFKDEDPIGQTLQIAFQNYRVVGIVKDVSPVFKDASSNIWIPFTSSVDYKHAGYRILLVAKDKNDFPAITQEVRDAEKKFSSDHTPETIWLKGPENQQRMTNTIGTNRLEDYEKGVTIENRKMIFILVMLLLIPALNLSGFSLSRIKKRMAEIGIRKAFGAKKYIILIQVLYENMITSLIGGVIGLIFSYLAILWLRHWLLGVPAGSPIPGNTMVSFPIFIAVFLACLLLNLLSAGISAYKASQMSIVNSLNQNDK